jgi:hypothetical protein
MLELTVLLLILFADSPVPPHDASEKDTFSGNSEEKMEEAKRAIG